MIFKRLVAIAILICSSSAWATMDKEELKKTLIYCDKAQDRDPRCLLDLMTELKATLGDEDGETFWRDCMTRNDYVAGVCVSDVVAKLRELNSFGTPHLVCIYDGHELARSGEYTSDKYIQVVKFYGSEKVTLSVRANPSLSDRQNGIIGGKELGSDTGYVDLYGPGSQTLSLSAAGIRVDCTYSTD